MKLSLFGAASNDVQKLDIVRGNWMHLKPVIVTDLRGMLVGELYIVLLLMPEKIRKGQESTVRRVDPAEFL